MQNVQIFLVMLLSSTAFAYYAPKQNSYGSNSYGSKPSRGYDSPGYKSPPQNPPIGFVVPPPPYSSESSSEEECEHEECHSIVDECLSSNDPDCLKLTINSNSPDVDVTCQCDNCDYILLMDDNNRVLKRVSRTN